MMMRFYSILIVCVGNICRSHQAAVELRHYVAPEVRGKTMRYGHWLQLDISDPYQQSREAFEFTFNLIADATQSWVQRLNK